MIMSVTPRRILVIDDEMGPRESLRILLKTQYEVHCADNVLSGLQLLKTLHPDVVVMDIRMPGMNGIDGLREIRALDPFVAVIMVTGFGALETAQEALRLGANDYIKKPFDTKEMLDVIARNAQRSEVTRKRARAEAELQELNERLLSELARKDQMAVLGQASAELMHDLRNPLTIALGYVQLLSEDLQKPEPQRNPGLAEAAEYIDVIQQSVNRCRDLVETWQSLNRRERRSREPVAMAGLAAEIARGAETLAAARGAQLVVVSGTEAESTVMGDRTQLLRTVQNLVGNAIEALPEQGGMVRLSVRREANEVVLCVEDNGCGIEPEHLERVFAAYFTTKAANKGTGLGLYITKRIVEEHGGQIRLRSVPKQGTSVTIRLPHAEAKGTAPSTATPATAGMAVTA